MAMDWEPQENGETALSPASEPRLGDPEALTSFIGWLFFSFVIAGLVRAGLDRGARLAGWELQDLIRGAIATLVFHGLILAGIFQFLRKNRLTWSQAFGRWTEKIGTRTLIGIGWGMVLFVVGRSAMWTWAWFLKLLSIQAHQQEAIVALLHNPSWELILILGILSLVVAPVMEELLFRGVLYKAMCETVRPSLALWSTAILFSLFHANLLTFGPLVVFGLLQALVYDRWRTLWPVIIGHATFNLINFLLALAQSGSS